MAITSLEQYLINYVKLVNNAGERMEKPAWCSNLKELVEFANWLDEECYFINTCDVIEFFEKPWKWQEEYDEYQNYLEKQSMSYFEDKAYNGGGDADVRINNARRLK